MPTAGPHAALCCCWVLSCLHCWTTATLVACPTRSVRAGTLCLCTLPRFCLLRRDTLAFMFETYYTPRLTPHAVGAPNIGGHGPHAAGRQMAAWCRHGAEKLCCMCFLEPRSPQSLPAHADRNYYQCWLGLKSHFDPAWTPEKAAGLQGIGAPAPAELAASAVNGGEGQQNGQHAAQPAGEA